MKNKKLDNLLERLLKIAKVERIEFVKTGNVKVGCAIMDGIRNRLLYTKTSTQIIGCANEKISAKWLIEKCLKNHTGIMCYNVDYSKIDSKISFDFDEIRFDECIIIPKVSSIEELEIWIDLHEN